MKVVTLTQPFHTAWLIRLLVTCFRAIESHNQRKKPVNSYFKNGISVKRKILVSYVYPEKSMNFISTNLSLYKFECVSCISLEIT